jgi:uncharacterized protein involved in exopolysaccharide biosynthesis
MEQNRNNQSLGILDDEIKLLPFFNTLKRGKIFIILLTSISSLYSIYYSGKIKPTYKGSFEILVTNSGSSNSQLSASSSIEGLLKMSGGTISNSKTQELILKSPSVLQPVFNFVVDEYSKRGIETESLNYKEWLESEIEIKFKKSSQVLEVIHLNNDKELIISVLNKISKRYQDFSKSAREKELKKSISYLKEQKGIFEKKSLEAIKKLNKFSIENGLGDIDGFVTLSQSSVEGQKTQAGQRFNSQFALLERYETQYTDLSSKLKKNSEVLQELALKIKNLRSSLKRPNEILIEYRELQRNAFNKDRLFNSIQSKLLAIQFEKAKQQDPWELISQPTVDKKKIAPNRLNISILYFLISSILGGLATIFYEKFKGNLFELDDIKKVIDCEYLETLFLNEKELSSIIFDNSIKSFNTNLESKNCIIILTKKNFMNLKFFIQELAISNNLEIIDKVNFKDINNLNSFDNLFFLVEPGQFTTSEFSIISKYMKTNKDKLKGWFLISNKP